LLRAVVWQAHVLSAPAHQARTIFFTHQAEWQCHPL